MEKLAASLENMGVQVRVFETVGGEEDDIFGQYFCLPDADQAVIVKDGVSFYAERTA